MVAHEFLEAHPPDFRRLRLLEPIRKLQPGPGNLLLANLKQYFEEALINLFGNRPPSGWLADRAPARAQVICNLPPAVIASVMNAR